MKVAYKLNDRVEIREEEPKSPGVGQIRIKIEACGICGTDIHSEELEFQKFGHEIAGEILELGAGVDYLQVGQKIVLDSATPCGRCDNCKNMQQAYCTNKQSFYYLDQFGFAEEMVAPAICAIPYAGLKPEVAILQEPLGVAWDLCRVSDINPNSNVLIIGQGPIGLMAVSVCKYLGAKHIFVSAFAQKTARKKLAESLGIDGFIDAGATSVTKYPFPCNIDRVLVTAPPPTLTSAFKVIAEGGIVGFIGIGHGASTHCTFDANEFHFKKLQLRASFASPALFGPKALSLISQGYIPADKLISHIYPLEKLEEALRVAKYDSSALKVVIKGATI